MKRHLSAGLSGLILASLLGSLPASAAGPFRNRDNPDPNDAAEGTYPIPYQQPTRAGILECLHRVRAFMERSAPTRIVDRATGREITDPRSAPVATAAVDAGPCRFNPITYDMGVVHSGMLYAYAVTGDRAFAAFPERHARFLRDWLPYFRALEEREQLGRRNPFAAALAPHALDDAGSMCAALIRTERAGLVSGLRPQIDVWSDHVLNRQFRFPDGTLARQRPQAESLWADDAYMSIPALAEMGRLTGDRKWFDDAVRQAMQLSHYLFVPGRGLYMHGLNRHYPNAPRFHWGRANGWMVLAMCDLLDVLPADHSGFDGVRAQLETALRGIAEYQDGNTGLWHQMLDRPDSYTETSASAMFVYGLAHAINRGWINPTTNGSIALAGWNGLTQRINAGGGVEGTCVGTTFASDPVYYYQRPTSVQALHGYGPMLLAGAEMIRLLENPAFEIQYKVRTYHFVPRDGRATGSR